MDVNITSSKDDVRVLFESEAIELVQREVKKAPLWEVPSVQETNNRFVFASWPRARVVDEKLTWQQTPLKPIGQLSNTFILAEGSDGLCLIDQHRAEERAIYELLLASNGNAPMELDEPIVLELKLNEAALLQRLPSSFEDISFCLEVFGDHHFLVRRIPSLVGSLPTRDLEGAFLDTLRHAEDGWLERLMASLSCRLAVHRGRPLSSDEIDRIVGPYCNPGAPTLCPHGQPIVLIITKDFLARQLDI